MAANYNQNHIDTANWINWYFSIPEDKRLTPCRLSNIIWFQRKTYFGYISDSYAIVSAIYFLHCDGLDMEDFSWSTNYIRYMLDHNLLSGYNAFHVINFINSELHKYPEHYVDFEDVENYDYATEEVRNQYFTLRCLEICTRFVEEAKNSGIHEDILAA